MATAVYLRDSLDPAEPECVSTNAIIFLYRNVPARIGWNLQRAVGGVGAFIQHDDTIHPIFSDCAEYQKLRESQHSRSGHHSCPEVSGQRDHVDY